VSTRILASGGAPPVEGVWTGPLARIDCETGEPVDDIRVRPQTGPAVVLQGKRQLSPRDCSGRTAFVITGLLSTAQM